MAVGKTIEVVGDAVGVIATHDEVANNEPHFAKLIETELELQEDAFIGVLHEGLANYAYLLYPGFSNDFPRTIDEYQTDPKPWTYNPSLWKSSPGALGIVPKGTKMHVTLIIGKTRYNTRLAYHIRALIDSGEWKGKTVQLDHLLSSTEVGTKFLGINEAYACPCEENTESWKKAKRTAVEDEIIETIKRKITPKSRPQLDVRFLQ